MLSNFGRSDGGRETWAYNFIPRLLDRYPQLSLDVFGLRIAGQADNSEAVLSAVPEDARQRIAIHFVETGDNRVPNALAFWRKLPPLARRLRTPAFVLAVGSWVELLATLRVPAFRGSAKLAWLRTIFADEKAHRYPRILKPLIEGAELSVLRRADRLIANGQDTAAYYRSRGLEVTVIPNAVELDRWRMPPPRLTSPIVVAYVGRLAQVKGIEEFVAAARRSGDGLKFVVAGDGPLRGLVERAEADGVLEYKGAVDNALMPELLSSVDVCVAMTFAGAETTQGSAGAGVSNALLEQIAAGRVVVCWDNPAYRQVLTAESCYFVPQGDVAALCDTLAEVAADPPAASIRAAHAAEIARSYGFDAHLAQFAAVARAWVGQEGVSVPPRSV